MAQFGALPEVLLDHFISSSACKSSCASIDVPTGAFIEVIAGACIEGHEEPRQLKEFHWTVDLLYQCTPCELHKPFSNITMKV
jgi:hypothetical protein